MQDGSDVGLITKVVSHPTLPFTITAHEDRHIRFFDNSTGKQTHVMVAHLDAVTSLAVDTNGLYLISGSHDSSVRLWNLETKTCIQEITAHRKKIRREYIRRRLPPFETLHRQCWRWCFGQSLCLKPLEGMPNMCSLKKQNKKESIELEKYEMLPWHFLSTICDKVAK